MREPSERRLGSRSRTVSGEGISGEWSRDTGTSEPRATHPIPVVSRGLKYIHLGAAHRALGQHSLDLHKSPRIKVFQFRNRGKYTQYPGLEKMLTVFQECLVFTDTIRFKEI